MERESARERRAARARLLLGDDRGTLDLETLRERLKAELSLSVPEDRVRWLMDSRRQGAEALGFEDLRAETFQAALDRLVSEVKEEERQAMMAERARELQAQKERREEAEAAQDVSLEPVEVNEDRSIGTRILGSLAYVLPLLDGLQFGAPLVQYLPFLAPVFTVLSVPNAFMNAIPFGSLAFFIAFSILANNRELPRLLRFNIQQAILLDVALFIPSLLVSLVSLASGAEDGGAAGEGLNMGVFAILTLAIAYSVIATLIGRDPDGLPVISDATRRGIDEPAP